MSTFDITFRNPLDDESLAVITKHVLQKHPYLVTLRATIAGENDPHVMEVDVAPRLREYFFDVFVTWEAEARADAATWLLENGRTGQLADVRVDLDQTAGVIVTTIGFTDRDAAMLYKLQCDEA